MSRFERIEGQSANPRLAVLYEEIVNAGFGKDVPLNWFTAQSGRPDILEATWGLTKGILLQGVLPPMVKQMIIVAVSAHNNCRYCAVVHTNALQAMGVPPEIIDRVTTDLDLAEVSPSQRAILRFALKTAKDPQSVTAEDFQVLREQGLNEGEIMEAAMVSAFANFINTWADVSGIQIDGRE